jgi:predicted Zn-dependent protease
VPDSALSRKHTFYKGLQSVMELKRVSVIIWFMKTSLLSLLFTLPLIAYADGLPDLGDVSQEIISPQIERQIGEQSMFQIRASNTYLDDPEISDYLNHLGGRLVANSTEPGDAFEFFAINDDAINAFALPGGFVGVNTGLILLAQDESELASVLGHEISHVTQHHYARMVYGQRYDSLAALATLAVAILAARNSPDAATAGIVGAQAGTIQHQLNFTRQNEREADRFGLAKLS